MVYLPNFISAVVTKLYLYYINKDAQLQNKPTFIKTTSDPYAIGSPFHIEKFLQVHYADHLNIIDILYPKEEGQKNAPMLPKMTYAHSLRILVKG